MFVSAFFLSLFEQDEQATSLTNEFAREAIIPTILLEESLEVLWLLQSTDRGNLISGHDDDCRLELSRCPTMLDSLSVETRVCK